MSLSWPFFRYRPIIQTSWENCKISFYRSVNAIFGRLGRYAWAEVIIQLLKPKCMPVLLYDFEACPIHSSDYRSIEHPVTLAFTKVFKTNSVTLVNECQLAFGFESDRRQIIKREIIIFLVKKCKSHMCVMR